MRLLAAVLTLLALACVPPVVIVPGDPSQCPAACQHLRALGCPEGDDLPDGTTCEKFCTDTQNNGHDLHPSCLASVATCADQAKCSR